MAALTHAGGIVVRAGDAGARYLLVTARGRPAEWVLPKGHISAGETPEEAVVREVREEAGVMGDIKASLGVAEFSVDGERVKVIYYLLNFVRRVPGMEADRAVAWCTFEEALRRLRFREAADALRRAHALVAP